MGSVFINYGVKAGGGPAFLKRQRSSVGQLQTRTRTGENYSQVQRRKANACNRNGDSRCRTCWGYPGWSNVSSCSAGGYSFCNNTTFRDPGGWPVQCRTVTLCRFTAFSGWSNTGSCSSATPACAPGALNRECRTVYSWGAWSAYQEVDVCTPTNPSLGAGAVQVECIAQ